MQAHMSVKVWSKRSEQLPVGQAASNSSNMSPMTQAHIQVLDCQAEQFCAAGDLIAIKPCWISRTC